MVQINKAIKHLIHLYMWVFHEDIEYDFISKQLTELPPARPHRFCTNLLTFKGSLLRNGFES